MELVLRGYPSSLRFAEWQQANSLPADKLPHLNEGQKARARDLRISERGYAISLKAAELARQRADAKMDRVARVIAEAVRQRDPEAEVTAVVWDFRAREFKFLRRVNGKEYAESVPTQILDDVILEKEGAEDRLRKELDYRLGGWAGSAA